MKVYGTEMSSSKLLLILLRICSQSDRAGYLRDVGDDTLAKVDVASDKSPLANLILQLGADWSC